jgi:hypothetical protein
LRALPQSTTQCELGRRGRSLVRPRGGGSNVALDFEADRVAAVIIPGERRCGCRRGELASPFGQAYSVAPERHVVEIVKVSGNGSLRFVINGHAFTAASGACGGWAAGDRVSLTAGEWRGYCATAVLLRNVTRRRSCEVLCNSW